MLTPSGILSETLQGCLHKAIAVLSGPSFANEVSRRLPAAVCAASSSIDAARAVQQAFSTNYFRVYTNSDVIGVELGGALKNVIAIAAGISDGGIRHALHLSECVLHSPETSRAERSLGHLVSFVRCKCGTGLYLRTT